MIKIPFIGHTSAITSPLQSYLIFWETADSWGYHCYPIKYSRNWQETRLRHQTTKRPVVPFTQNATSKPWHIYPNHLFFAGWRAEHVKAPFQQTMYWHPKRSKQRSTFLNLLMASWYTFCLTEEFYWEVGGKKGSCDQMPLPGPRYDIWIMWHLCTLSCIGFQYASRYNSNYWLSPSWLRARLFTGLSRSNCFYLFCLIW